MELWAERIMEDMAKVLRESDKILTRDTSCKNRISKGEKMFFGSRESHSFAVPYDDSKDS